MGNAISDWKDVLTPWLNQEMPNPGEVEYGVFAEYGTFGEWRRHRGG